MTKYDASEKYQPKGDYLTESKANSRFLWEYNFKDKLLEVLGVRYSIEQNGYICFGSLFGGLIIQWGETTKHGEYTGYHYIKESDFPIKFPNNTFFLFVNRPNVSGKKFYYVKWIVIGR